MNKIKLAIYSVNPVQYHAPIFKALAKEEDIEATVLFGSDIGLKPFYNKEVKAIIEWDIPLVEGYRHKFFRNFAKNNSRGTFSRINLGMFSHIIKNRYDVVLIHGYDTISSWIVFLAAKCIRAKIIWRGEAAIRVAHRQSIFKKFLKTKILPWYFRRCNAVMYSCTGNKEYLDQFKVPQKKMFLIPCAVDNTFFRKGRLQYIHKTGGIRKDLGINGDAFVILFSSRFTIRKRPLDLIEAVSKIENKNIVLLFVGDGLEKENMKKLVNKYAIKAVFTGLVGQKELPKYYGIADLYAIISDYDASPKSLNEALNFELPILVTDKVGTSKDLVTDHQNGFIVKSRDVKAMAEKIDFFNKNRNLAKEMGEKSLAISNEWSIENDIIGIKQAIEYTLLN